jgi:hypothetical protein
MQMFAPGALIVAIGVVVALIGLIAAVIAIARSPRSLQRDNPNLRPCRDCGCYISIRAATCPHCGGPNKG